MKNRNFFPRCTISHKNLGLPQIHCPFLHCKISLFFFICLFFSYFFIFFAFLKKATSVSVPICPCSLLEYHFRWYQVLTNYQEIRFIGFLEGSISIQKIEKFLSKIPDKNLSSKLFTTIQIWFHSIHCHI